MGFVPLQEEARELSCSLLGLSEYNRSWQIVTWRKVSLELHHADILISGLQPQEL